MQQNNTNFKGTVGLCDLTPNSLNYNYDNTINDLENIYGFKYIGEGGFGVVLGNDNCVVKIIKDISRCTELEKEKQIYNIIETQRDTNLIGKIPKFHIYNHLNTFCHFNTEKIYPALSGWGDINDDDYGSGYVISSNNNMYTFNDLDGEIYGIKKDNVYSIDRPGNLIHFYINHFDMNLKEKLDNNQGYLFGLNNLTKYFSDENIKIFSYAVGQLLSFLIFKCGIAPIDIEVVIGSKDKNNREPTIFIYDFNECILIDNTMNINSFCEYITQSLYLKNGKNYFPSLKNPYYTYFSKGFLDYTDKSNKVIAECILNLYNSKFK